MFRTGRLTRHTQNTAFLFGHHLPVFNPDRIRRTGHGTSAALRTGRSGHRRCRDLHLILIRSVSWDFHGTMGTLLQFFSHFSSKLQDLLLVFLIRPSGANLRHHRMLRHKRCRCRYLKATFLQDVLKLQQRILVSPVSIHRYSDCFLSLSVQSPQLFCCHSRNPAAKNRHSRNYQIPFWLPWLFLLFPQIYRFYIPGNPLAQQHARFLCAPGGTKIV